MPNVVASLFHDLTSPDTNPPDFALSGRFWITLFMIILVPLAFLRRLDSLRHTSYVALFSVGRLVLLSFWRNVLILFVAYLVVIVITAYFWPLKGTMAPGEIRLIHFTPNFVSTFPVQVFAFTCAQNVRSKHNLIACVSHLSMIAVSCVQ